MSEIRLINKELGEIEINNKGYFAIPDDIYNAIEQLQQENEELKEQIKLFKKDLAKAENTCQKYHSRYCDIKLILTEFEKWLEETINYLNRNKESYENYRVQILTYKYCLDKLQELKEGEK